MRTPEEAAQIQRDIAEERKSFVHGAPQVATDKDLATKWSGGKPGERFRCYLCGHKFEVGDAWRFVYANGTPGTMGNFMVCKPCDVEPLAKMVAAVEELKSRFWWAL